MLIFFPHIPKAGGESLKHGFYEAFGRDKCIKVWQSSGSDTTSRKFPDLDGKKLEAASAVVGHLPLASFLSNVYAKREFDQGNVKIITSVRDPIERLVSEYNYISRNNAHPIHHKVRQLSAIDYIRTQPANFQFSFLKPFVDSTIVDIKRTILIFPVENSIQCFQDYFCHNLDIKLSSMKIRNKTIDIKGDSKLFRSSDLDNRDFHFLREKHEIDFALYSMSLIKDQ